MDRMPPAATCLSGLLALLLSVPGLLQGRAARESVAADSALSLRPGKVLEGEVYRLVTFIFVYDDAVSLVCGAVVIWYFAGSFEKTVGTVKHVFLTVVFAVFSALLFLGVWAAASGLLEIEDAKGFAPVAFAMLSTSIARSRMRRVLLLGFSIPVALVPWLALCLACFVPGSSLLANLCGLFLGNIYGYSYCFGIDLPESTASRLDQKFPFQLLKRIPRIQYIPGSLAERRASQSRKINPVPGSYPTQKYHSSPPPVHVGHMQHPQARPPGPLPLGTLGPTLNQPPRAFRDSHVQASFHLPAGTTSASLSGTGLWIPKGTDGSPLSHGPESSAAEICQVQVK
uniref:Rhomboid domain containing 2 n=1 Tax=Salvator merianae TaxID=96440 RepID=A0A8D0B7W3_SALMN